MTAGRVGGMPREFVSFAAIGATALFVDLAALFLALNLLGLGYYAGRLFSYLVAATYTWALNRTFTFRQAPRRGALRQWARFLAANAIGGGVNYLTYAAIVTWGPGLAPPLLADALPLLPYAATAAGSVAGMGFNFVASKWLVFRTS